VGARPDFTFRNKPGQPARHADHANPVKTGYFFPRQLSPREQVVSNGSTTKSDPEILEFDDLSPYLFLKNGNYLYKVPYRDGWAILKVYYGSKTIFETLQKSFGNVVLQGQTSYMPKTRCHIERSCMELWAKHGFPTFEIYDVEVRAPGCVPGGYLLMEYVEAPELLDFLVDDSVSLDARFEVYRKWLPEWSRRHDLAIELREPLLVHENGDGGHVMLRDGQFIWFDFEMVYRSRSAVPMHVAHELAQYTWHVYKSIPEPMRARFLKETVEGYPNRERLLSAYDYFHKHPNLFLRAARALDRRFGKKAKKPTSKYSVTAKLKEQVEQA